VPGSESAVPTATTTGIDFFHSAARGSQQIWMCVVCLAACWAPAAIAAAPNDMFVYKWLIWVSLSES